MFNDAARDAAYENFPEIRAEVAELLAERKDKSLMSEMSYVKCPFCGRRHYRNEIITIEEKSHVQPVVKPSDDTSHVTPKGVTFAAIGNMLK